MESNKNSRGRKEERKRKEKEEEWNQDLATGIRMNRIGDENHKGSEKNGG